MAGGDFFSFIFIFVLFHLTLNESIRKDRQTNKKLVTQDNNRKIIQFILYLRCP